MEHGRWMRPVVFAREAHSPRLSTLLSSFEQETLPCGTSSWCYWPWAASSCSRLEMPRCLCAQAPQEPHLPLWLPSSSRCLITLRNGADKERVLLPPTLEGPLPLDSSPPPPPPPPPPLPVGFSFEQGRSRTCPSPFAHSDQSSPKPTDTQVRAHAHPTFCLRPPT